MKTKFSNFLTGNIFETAVAKEEIIKLSSDTIFTRYAAMYKHPLQKKQQSIGKNCISVFSTVRITAVKLLAFFNVNFRCIINCFKMSCVKSIKM